MVNSLINSITDVCKILHKHHVQFLIVGGTAVALHGYFRISMASDGKPANKHDLDFWYNPTYTNYYNLLNALEESGLDVKDYKEEESPNPRKSFFRFETSDFTLDFLPRLKDITKFQVSFNNKEIVDIKGTEIWFINYNDLIKDKISNSRPKDLLDIQQLKNNKKSEDKS